MADLIESHIPYSHAIAAEMLKRFPRHVERREVEAAAELGLVQAANAYDSSRGIAFTTFAYYRIRGAVFDLLRQVARTDKFEMAGNEYMTDYSSAPPDPENRASYEEIKRVTASIVTSYFLSLEALPQEPTANDDESPIDRMVREEQQKRIRSALATLPEKNRRVLECYYFEDLTLDEIGKRLGLSKSWVSRMHAKGLEMLRPLLEQTMAESIDAAALTKDREGSSSGRYGSTSP